MDASSGFILCLATGISAWLLTFAARSAAPKLGIVDRPGGRKKHLRTTPLMGGVALYLAFVIGVLATQSITRQSGTGFSFWLLVCGGLFCLIGLIDDKWSMRARDKFVLQVLASLPFAIWGQSIQSIQFLGMELNMGWAGVAFTVFWLVACTNVVNLLDGIDGLASSLGVIIASAVCALSLMYGKMEVAAASVVLVGALLGFLGHNLPPAKIFLGDAGSLTIGFMTGALAIEGSTKTATGFMLCGPLVVMSIPAFDAFLAIVRRKLNGRGIGAADRGHIHHRLLDRGLSGSQVLAAIVGLCLAMALAAVGSAYFQSDLLGLATCGVIIAVLMAAKIWGGHESELFFRHLQLAGGVMADATGVFRSRMVITRLEMSDQVQRENYWDTLCHAAQTAGATQLQFNVNGADGDSQRVWRTPHTEPLIRSCWRIEYQAERSQGAARVQVNGASPSGQRAKGMDELLGLAAVLCQTWPLEVSANQELESAQKLELAPASEENGKILEFPQTAAEAGRSDPKTHVDVDDKRRAA